MEPESIKKLDECVVNRIAAGEIIQRPANALKEMLENSIDAKSTIIQVTVKSGGLKYLQIQDNGTGIRTEDLPIVCERFTTSKLRTFEDLTAISTYGFRGEALASISHVAHLTIQTKTAGNKCGYRASYKDGKMVGEPKPMAGNQGTQIIVEDLFHNVRQRRQALSSPHEEYQRITDVISKYAIHNASIGFGLKKFGENQHLKTQPGSTINRNISLLYGNEIGKDLMEIHLADTVLGFTMHSLITNANYSAKKLVFLLFINHRLVDSSGIKVTIDQVYSQYLPKGRHPFVYMSLEIEASNVDVNVHPTKHEVHFLHEEVIVERIKAELEVKLLGNNASRTFLVQSLLPGAMKSDENEMKSEKEKVVYAKDLVRSDSKEQKIEKFFGNTSLTQLSQHNEDSKQPSNVFQGKKVNTVRRDTKLTSVLELRKTVEQKCHIGLRKILNNLIFVGCVTRTHALIQHETSLYLTNTKMLAEELFYQLSLYDFENFGTITLDNPLSVYELAMLALDCEESSWTPDDGPKEELANTVRDILVNKAIIMKEYYNVIINDDGYLETLPVLLEGHVPTMTYLPMFILRLATEVEWEDESGCFKTFSRETAIFYAEFDESDDRNQWQWQHEHIFYAAFKKFLLPIHKFMSNKCFLQIANLSNLYKVFERC